MNVEDIQKFLDRNETEASLCVKISFKKRNPIFGRFVRDKDYTHLKSKNFWRIITQLNFDEYLKSSDLSLAKIFNGAEFTRLSTSV